MQKKAIVALAAGFVAVLGLAAPASAFHSGGVAECGGCHVMHNASYGEVTVNNRGVAGYVGAATGSNVSNTKYLLNNTDQSSTCLACHHGASDVSPSSYHVSAPYGANGAVERTPGGDFAWLSKDYTWTVRGTNYTSEGERHGHSVIAADFAAMNYVEDAGRAVIGGGDVIAPGADAGGFGDEGEDMTCIACHDPHGQYRIYDTGAGALAVTIPDPTVGGTYPQTFGNGSYNNSRTPTATESIGVYRLLAGKNYSADSWNGTHSFQATVDPPWAVAPSTYNRTEATDQTRVAYGQGMSEWCANCHTNMHNDVTSTFRHIAGNGADLGATIANNYMVYVGTGNLTNAVPTQGYWSLIPFEEGTNDIITTLRPHAVINDSYLNSPTSTMNVMCLTCHRAHASAWDFALRWNAESDYVTYGGVYPTDAGFAQGRTQAEQQSGLYDRDPSEFSSYQRTLCNKCHIQD